MPNKPTIVNETPEPQAVAMTITQALQIIHSSLTANVNLLTDILTELEKGNA
jgi:hypothetical protein